MRSIRRSLLISLLPLLLILAGASGAALYLHARSALTDQFDQALRAKAEAFAATAEQDAEGRIEIDLADVGLPEFQPSAAPEYFQIWRATGQNLLRSPSLGGGDLHRPANGEASPACFDQELPDGRPGRAVSMPFAPRLERDDAPPGPSPIQSGDPLVLVLARSRSGLDDSLAILLLGVILVGLLLPALAGVWVVVAVRRGLAPLDGLARQAGTVYADDLGTRFPADGLPTELQPICRRLNSTFARLETAFARERRFSAAAAHELRTPIAELRSLAEVGLTGACDPDQRQALLDALDISVQMGALVEALLAYSRAESGRVERRTEPVDLGDLLRERVKHHRDIADSRSLQVKVRAADDLMVATDPALARAILDNLVLNACEHTPAGGRVTLTARADGRAVRLTVDNAAEDMRTDDLKHLTEPLWRGDDARTDGRHSGLGLSMVAVYADLLGIAITFELPEEGIFRVRLDWPADSPGG